MAYSITCKRFTLRFKTLISQPLLTGPPCFPLRLCPAHAIHSYSELPAASQIHSVSFFILINHSGIPLASTPGLTVLPLENHKDKEHEEMDDDKGLDTHFEPRTWKLELKFLQENKKVKRLSRE